MENIKCELCGNELQENIDLCSNCYWPCASDVEELPEVIKRQQQMLEATKKYWEGWITTYNEYLEISKENSYLKKHLKVIYSQFQDIDTKVNFSHNEPLDKCNQEFDGKSTRTFASTELESQVGESDNDSLICPDEQNVNDSSETTDLVKHYNEILEFHDKIEVSETESSKYQRWNGSKSPAIFELNKRGDYWVINNAYLVPKRNHKINEHSYKTVSIFFECVNYDKSSINFKLINPAKVNCLNNQKIWQLEEKGILEFS